MMNTRYNSDAQRITNEDAFSILESVIHYLEKADDYWIETKYQDCEQAITILRQAYKSIGPTGEIAPWER